MSKNDYNPANHFDRDAAMERLAAQQVAAIKEGKVFNPKDREEVINAVATRFASGEGISEDSWKLMEGVLGGKNGLSPNMNGFSADIVNIESDDPKARAAAFKVAVYKHFTPPEVSKEMTPKIIGQYAAESLTGNAVNVFESSEPDRNFTRSVMDAEQLAKISKGVECIAAVVVSDPNNPTMNPRTKEALQAVSGEIVEEAVKLRNRGENDHIKIEKGIVGVIKEKWNGFIKGLEDLTKMGKQKNDRAENLKNFVMGKTELKQSNTPTPPAAGGKSPSQQQTQR